MIKQHINIRVSGKLFARENLTDKFIVEGLAAKENETAYLAVRSTLGELYQCEIIDNSVMVESCMIPVPGLLRVMVIIKSGGDAVRESKTFYFPVFESICPNPDTPPSYGTAKTLAEQAVEASKTSVKCIKQGSEIYYPENGMITMPAQIGNIENINADMLDGYHSSYYLDKSNLGLGTLIWSGSAPLSENSITLNFNRYKLFIFRLSMNAPVQLRTSEVLVIRNGTNLDGIGGFHHFNQYIFRNLYFYAVLENNGQLLSSARGGLYGFNPVTGAMIQNGSWDYITEIYGIV